MSTPKPDTQSILLSVESPTPIPSHVERSVAILHLIDLDSSFGSFDSAIIKEKMLKVGQLIAMMTSSQKQESSKMELQPGTTNILMNEEPVVIEVQAVPTVSDLLA